MTTIRLNEGQVTSAPARSTLQGVSTRSSTPSLVQMGAATPAEPVSTPATTCGNCGKHHRRLTTLQCEDRSMLEKTLQNRVVGRAKRRKWLVAHAGRGMVGTEGQIVTPMLPGWPDLFLLRPPRALAIELKRELGGVDDKQWVLLKLLNQCGIPAVVIRPSDLREGRVDAILA